MHPNEINALYRQSRDYLNDIIRHGHVSKQVIMQALEAELQGPPWLIDTPLLPDQPGRPDRQVDAAVHH